MVFTIRVRVRVRFRVRVRVRARDVAFEHGARLVLGAG